MIVDTNMSFENSNNAVKNYVDQLEKMKTELRNTFTTILADDFYALRHAFPGLEKIFVVGWTPEWNDGEDCYHNSSVYIENDPNLRWDDMGEYVDRIHGDDSVVEDEFLHVNTSLSKEEVKKIKSILSETNLEENLHEVFGTNYNIIIDLSEEDIKVHVKGYHCGY